MGAGERDADLGRRPRRRLHVNQDPAACGPARAGRTGLRCDPGQEGGCLQDRGRHDPQAFVVRFFSPFTRSLKARLVSLVGILSLSMVIIGASGLIGMNQINRHAQSIYEDRSVPLAQLFEINDRMKENSLAIFRSSIEARSGHATSNAQSVISANAGRIDKLWSDYMATYLTPEEKSVAGFVRAEADRVRRAWPQAGSRNAGRWQAG